MRGKLRLRWIQFSAEAEHMVRRTFRDMATGPPE